MRAIGMVGSNQSIKMLSEALKKQGVNLENRDFVAGEEITEFLKSTAEIVAVVIVERQSLADGRENVINQIRSSDPDVRIVWCSGKEMKDAEFENWGYKQRVYDFLYPDKNGSFNITEMGNCILKGRISLKEADATTKENKRFNGIFNKYSSQKKGSGSSDDSKQQKQPVPVKEIIIEKPVEVIREVIVEKPVEVIKEVYVDRPVPVEEVREIFIEKPIEVIRNVVVEKPIIRGVISFAIHCLSEGAGATSMVITLAEFLAGIAKTAAIGVDGSNDLSFVKGKAEYFVLPDINDIANAMYQLFHDQFQFVVADYGQLFMIDGNGDLNKEKIQEKKSLLPEFFRSDHKIGLGFAAPWHLGKLKFFSENDMFQDKIHDGSYSFVLDDEMKKARNKYGIDSIYCRQDFRVEQILSKVIPELQKNARSRPKKFKFGLWHGFG